MNAWWNLSIKDTLTLHSLHTEPSKSNPFPMCRSDPATRMLVAIFCRPEALSFFARWYGISSAMPTSSYAGRAKITARRLRGKGVRT